MCISHSIIKISREKPGLSKLHCLNSRQNLGFDRNRRLIFRRFCKYGGSRWLCHARLTYANTRERVRQSNCSRWKMRGEFQQLKGNCGGDGSLSSWWKKLCGTERENALEVPRVRYGAPK